MTYSIIIDTLEDVTYGPYPSDEIDERMERLGGVEYGMVTQELAPDEVHWGHELHAARDTLGLSLESIAKIVGVSRTRIVKMWERRDDLPVPYDVWVTMERMLEDQVSAVETALRVIDESGATTVRLAYWDNQADYDANHYVSDGGRYEIANATNRRIAEILEYRGIEVTWVDGAHNPVPHIDNNEPTEEKKPDGYTYDIDEALLPRDERPFYVTLHVSHPKYGTLEVITNKDLEGRFQLVSNDVEYYYKQVAGTLQFSLPKDEAGIKRELARLLRNLRMY
jgi:hypothetical protein